MAFDFSTFGKSTGTTEPVNEKTKSIKKGFDFENFGTPTTETAKLEQDGIVKSLVKAPLTILARPIQLAAETIGQMSAENVNKATKKIAGDFVAPVPENYSDVKKDIGRGIQTVALGLPGVASGGAAFGLGSSLEQGNDLASVDTAFQTALGAVGGKVLGLVGKPLLDVSGKVVGKITPQVLKDVASQGTKAIEDFAAKHEILPKNVSNVINKGADLAETVTNKPFEIAGNVARKGLPKPENIMNRVARLTPSDAVKFEKMTGKTHGQYLTDTGNFGTPENIIKNEYQKFLSSKQSVDEALSKLEGNFKDDSVKGAIDELVNRENRIGFSGGDASRIKSLSSKFDKEGLNMSEINEVKRLFERNNKLDYLRGNVPEGIEKSNRIDDAIRKFQFSQAEKLGLKNLPELNKQTQASKFIVDKLGKQIYGKTGNDAINITDWILLSGGDPTAIAGFAAKKFFGNKGVQASIAKSLAGKTPKTLPIKPQFGGKTGLPALIKGRDYSIPKPNNAKYKPISLPESVRETNIGLDQIKRGNIKNPQ